MVSVIEGAKALFSNCENKINHLYLFFVAAVISVISTYFEISKSGELFTTLLAAIVYMVLAVYLSGYTLKFTNNVFKDKEKLLPDFNAEPFKIFIKALPLYVLWIVYTLIYCIATFIITSILASALPQSLLFIAMAVILAFVLFVPFISYIFVAYAKEYNIDGLFRIDLPFHYMKKAFTDTWITILKLILLSIVAMIPIVFLALLIGIFLPSGKVMTYFTGILGGYVSIVFTFILEYCLVKIYKEKLEN